MHFSECYTLPKFMERIYAPPCPLRHYNSQNTEAAQVTTDRQVDKKAAVYRYNGI